MEETIQKAIDFTNKLISKGLLVWHEIPKFDSLEEESAWWCTLHGDRETLYSIASLFANENHIGFSENEARDILEDVLCEMFPTYCD